MPATARTNIRPRRLLDLYTIREKQRPDRRAARRDHRRHSFQPRRALEHFRSDSNWARASRWSARARSCRASLRSSASTVSHHIDDVLPTADVVNLLRIQHERQRKEYFPGLGEYIRLFGLTKERAKRLKPDCLIMHPGPINRGVEIDSEVADGSAKRDSRSSHQRPRRAHGGSLSLRRNRHA